MIGTLATNSLLLALALKDSSQSGHIYHIGCDQVYHALTISLPAFANSLDPSLVLI